MLRSYRIPHSLDIVFTEECPVRKFTYEHHRLSPSLLPHPTKTRPCVSWALTTACPRLPRLRGWSWPPTRDRYGSGGASRCFPLRRKLLALLQGCTLSSERLKALRACSDYFHFPDSTWQNKWVNSRDLSSL